MLYLDNVKKRRGEFSLDCSLKIEKGTIVGLVGANGAGKTTIFSVILGLTDIDDGDIVFNFQENLSTLDKKRKIGVVLSESGYSEFLNPVKIAGIIASMYPNFRNDLFLKLCEKQKIPLKKKMKDFSDGMKALFKVICAVSYDPDILLLDEPTSGLDVVAREGVLDIIRKFTENGDKAVLISSHIADDIESICDSVYVIDQGRICFNEETDRIKYCYGLLKLNEKQFKEIDKEYIMRVVKENYGYACLTSEKKYYRENWKDIVIEDGSIDIILKMIIKSRQVGV